MDEAERLMAAFGARGKRHQSTWKLGVLMDLAALDDVRVGPFLRAVLADGAEPVDVRIDALRRLWEAARVSDDRAVLAESGLRVLRGPSDGELRRFSALVLGDVADVRGVVAALGALALDADEALDLRYTAFTSVQRAGPTAECVALLRALCRDESLGPSARSVLVAWGEVR
jgi:hypothetical protein